MIDLKELRIGNCVILTDINGNGFNKIITGLNQEKIYLNHDNTNAHPITVIDPIRLSKDILQQSGFKFTGDEWFECTLPYGKLNYNLKFQVCSISDNDYTNECILTEYNFIKYFHQLQNIYFFISGKELMFTF